MKRRRERDEKKDDWLTCWLNEQCKFERTILIVEQRHEPNAFVEKLDEFMRLEWSLRRGGGGSDRRWVVRQRTARVRWRMQQLSEIVLGVRWSPIAWSVHSDADRRQVGRPIVDRKSESKQRTAGLQFESDVPMWERSECLDVLTLDVHSLEMLDRSDRRCQRRRSVRTAGRNRLWRDEICFFLWEKKRKNCYICNNGCDRNEANFRNRKW